MSGRGWNSYRIIFSCSMGHYPISEADNKTLVNISKIFADGASNEDKTEKNIDLNKPMTNWAPYPSHGNIAYYSAMKVLPFSDSNVLYNAVDDPDAWQALPAPPGWYLYWDFINLVVHSYTHYYNPDYGWGTAPGEAAGHANSGRTSLQQGDRYLALSHAGWSCHYLTDVLNPQHTGDEAWQAVNKWGHDRYETWVSNDAAYFVDAINSDMSYYPVSDVGQMTIINAQYSHPYIIDTIRYAVITNSYDANVRSITRNMMIQGSRSNLGMLQYVGLW